MQEVLTRSQYINRSVGKHLTFHLQFLSQSKAAVSSSSLDSGMLSPHGVGAARLTAFELGMYIDPSRYRQRHGFKLLFRTWYPWPCGGRMGVPEADRALG